MIKQTANKIVRLQHNERLSKLDLQEIGKNLDPYAMEIQKVLESDHPNLGNLGNLKNIQDRWHSSIEQAKEQAKDDDLMAIVKTVQSPKTSTPSRIPTTEQEKPSHKYLNTWKEGVSEKMLALHQDLIKYLWDKKCNRIPEIDHMRNQTLYFAKMFQDIDNYLTKELKPNHHREREPKQIEPEHER